MFKLLAGIFKIAVASLLAGAALSALDITAADLLADIGLTPEAALEFLERGARWAVPNLVLGSIIVVPIWIVVYLFRPPRG